MFPPPFLEHVAPTEHDALGQPNRLIEHEGFIDFLLLLFDRFCKRNIHHFLNSKMATTHPPISIQVGIPATLPPTTDDTTDDTVDGVDAGVA